MRTKQKANNKNGVSNSQEKMKNKDYLRELRKLHVELVKLQEWTKSTGAKICIVFEGRDGAGKGISRGCLARPHRAREIANVRPALSASPAGGGRDRDLRSQLVQSGRRRACHGLLYRRRGALVPEDRSSRREGDCQLRNYPPEILARGEPGGTDPASRSAHRRRAQDLAPMDLKSYSCWYDYSRARDEMFQATDTAWAPWFVAHSDDTRRARLNIITHLLGKIPYKSVPRPKIKLPKRQKPRGYEEPDYPYKMVPEKY
jgi:polyphosphate kinase